MDDYELLQAYAARRAEDAFQTLTERYMRLVYSAAMRQTGNSQAAQDVTQAVFLTLARKAGTLSREVVLSGWLLRTTRYAAANARRLEQRRQHYEREAMQAPVQTNEADTAWQRIAPMLDEAVDALSENDRNALVLRFFEGMPLRAVAQRLGVSEDGAQKRVSRAVEKLRSFFDRRGRVVAGGALAAAISANALQSTPAIAVRATSQAGQTLMEATLNTLARIRLQTFAIRAAATLVLLSVAVLPFVRSMPKANVAVALSAANPTSGPVALRRPFAAAAVSQPQRKQLLLRVVDAQSGAPVSHARLTLVSAAPNSSRSTNIFSADANGMGVIFYSPELITNWNHRIEVFRDAYVPKFVSWSEYQQDRFEEIPAEYTLKVDPAVTIGGTVTDEEGNPVPEARIVFSMSGPTQSRSRERLTMMGNYHAEVADVNGRWSCSHVPARFGMITFKPTHPQFQDKTFVPDSPDSPPYVNVDRIPEADFLAGRAIMRLKRGLVIAGVVVDERAEPVAGAKVTQHWSYLEPERYRITGPDGAFRFQNGRPKETFLTVQAAAFAPVVTSIVLQADADQLRFVLPPGKQLTGRVVDENGQGVSGAWIAPASPRADSTVRFEWRTKADADGRFAWDSAPAKQEYSVSASGFESQPRVNLTAEAGEQLVRLTRKASSASVRILGQLLDAETRQPLARGSVQLWQTSKDLSSFTSTPETAADDGKFRLKTSSGTVSYVLEGQAEGYWPKRLTNQVTADSEVWLDIALTKAPDLAGTVVTPAGTQAAGATLVVCGPTDWAQMLRPGRLQMPANSSVTGAVADDQGRFRLPTSHAPQSVVVAHPEGFVSVPFTVITSNTQLRLQPWGRIEGMALLGGKPLVNERIYLSGWLKVSPRVSISSRPTTDSEGRFAFDTIPPGTWRVQRDVGRSAGTQASFRMPHFSHGVAVDVRPGETAAILLGGSGNTVFGKAIAPQPISPEIWTENSVALLQKEPLAEYRALFNHDGSFRVQDIPAGEYTLTIKLTQTSAPVGNFANFNFKPLASLEKPVTVSTDSDLDLGSLELQPAK